MEKAACLRRTPRTIVPALLRAQLDSLTIFALMVFLEMLASVGDASFNFLNTILPLVVVGTCGRAVIRLYGIEPAMALNPLFAFFMAFGAFFGLGPLAHIFGNEDTSAYINRNIPVTAEELFRTTELNILVLAVCINVAVLAFRMAWTAGVLTLTQRIRYIDPKKICYILLGVGIVYRYAIKLPADLRLVNYAIPGILVFGDAALQGGIFLASYLAPARRLNRKISWLVMALALLGFLLGMLQFNKSEALFSLAIPMLGLMIGGLKGRFAFVSLFSLGLIYVLLIPVAGAGRLAFHESASFELGKRFEFILSYVKGEATDTKLDEAQGWWLRLNYANVQAFAMYLYDSGRPGDSFGNIFMALVPRVLYPDKPNMNEGGVEFTYKAFGHRGSSTGLGFGADAYYNYGLPGVIVCSTFVGLVLGVLGAFSLLVMQRENFIYLPCVLISFKIGYDVASRFVEVYIGGTVIVAALITLTWVIFKRRLRHAWRRAAPRQVRTQTGPSIKWTGKVS